MIEARADSPPDVFYDLAAQRLSGIAVGMATNIPPHNLREVCEATIAKVDNPELDSRGLMQWIKGPDFPSGGIIMGTDGIVEAYTTGRGSIPSPWRCHHRTDSWQRKPPEPDGHHRDLFAIHVRS